MYDTVVQLEVNQENILPVPEGRTLTGYNRREDRVVELGRLRAQVECSSILESDDPLAAHVEYLEKLRDFNPHSTHYKRALEDCASQFTSWKIYLYDLRYLRVWLAYAGLFKDPSEVFRYMYNKSIGVEYALFWEEWAAASELGGKIELARETLSRANTLNVHPLSRIKYAAQCFDKRNPCTIAARIPRNQGVSDSQQTKRLKIFQGEETDCQIFPPPESAKAVFPSFKSQNRENVCLTDSMKRANIGSNVGSNFPSVAPRSLIVYEEHTGQIYLAEIDSVKPTNDLSATSIATNPAKRGLSLDEVPAKPEANSSKPAKLANPHSDQAIQASLEQKLSGMFHYNNDHEHRTEDLALTTMGNTEVLSLHNPMA